MSVADITIATAAPPGRRHDRSIGWPTSDVARERTPAAILSHPRFGAARRAYIDALLDLYEHDPFMNRLLMEAGRSVAFFNILCLAAAYEEHDRATWPMMQLLQRTLEPYDVTSARRVHDIVARLVGTGYLESRIAPGDRRARILTPTAKMLEHDHDWLMVHYLPLHTMFPDPGYGPAMRRDPAYRTMHRKVGRRVFSHAVRLMASHPAVMLFMRRDSGMMILIKLLQRADRHTGAEPGEVSRRMLFTDVADRFGVSRTHVRSTLQAAERADLVRMTERSVVIAPLLAVAFDRFVADTMAAHHRTFCLAISGLSGIEATRRSCASMASRAGPRAPSHGRAAASPQPMTMFTQIAERPLFPAARDEMAFAPAS